MAGSYRRLIRNLRHLHEGRFCPKCGKEGRRPMQPAGTFLMVCDGCGATWNQGAARPVKRRPSGPNQADSAPR